MGLQQLYLTHNGLTSAGVEALMASPVTRGPEILRLNMNPIGDAGARAIGARVSQSLTTLFLARTEMTDTGFRALVDSPRLASLDGLDVTSNPLSTAVLGAPVDPAKLPVLTTLEVDAKATDSALLEKRRAGRPSLKINAE